MKLITDVATSVASMFAAGTLFWGVYRYRKDQISKRKDTIFPLIHEFDDDLTMELAKKILDSFKLRDKYWQHATDEEDYYQITNLDIFRHHDEKSITDTGEIEIRKSFDALLDFFGKLGYLLDVGLINEKEINYFRYYIEKAANSEAVGRYVSNYNFKLYEQLLGDLNLTQKKLQ